MREFVFSVGLPPKEASPNTRAHWAEVRRATTGYRAQCKMTAKLFMMQSGIHESLPVFKKAIIDYEFFLGTRKELREIFYHPRDEDNARASMKAAQDGFVDAGLFPNDSAKYVSLGKVVLHTKKKDHQGRACVVVTIREIE